jgi:hypothetical protein
MKVFYVQRQLIGYDDTALNHPVKMCATEAIAKECITALQKQTEAVLAGHITVMTKDGPRAVMSVKQFLADLGVKGMNFPVITDDLHESNLVLARPGVQLQ